MNCCCDSQTLMGALGPFYGLGGLGKLLVKGSLVRVGFAYNGYDPLNQGEDDARWVSDVLRGALLGSGVFETAEVLVTPPKYGGLQDGYILIKGTTWVDRNDPEDIGNLAQHLIQDYFPFFDIERRDPVIIDGIPQAQVNNPNAQQPNAPADNIPRGTLPVNNAPPPPPPPSKCDWDTMSFGDYVACQLGITGTVGGIAAGATGALIGVGVLTVIAVTLFKR